MKHLILYFLLITATSAPANDIDLQHSYDLQAMQVVIDSVSGLQSIPVFSGIDRADEVDRIDGEPREEALALFKKVQKNIIGRDDLIQLKLCESCGFVADYFSKTVFITPGEVDIVLHNKSLKEPQQVLIYIFTHEISHFIHEISAHPPHSEEHFKTINSLTSAYISDASIQKKLKIEDVLKTHAEVDAFASLVLKGNGFSAWDDVFTFLEDEIVRQEKSQDDPYTTQWVVADFSNRKRVISETVNK